MWQDVTRAAKAAGLIGAELTKATGNPDYAECGTLLQGDLMTVNDEVAATLATVPEDRRILVTDHDALGYLAAAYGYTVAGTVDPGRVHPGRAELGGAGGPGRDRQGGGRPRDLRQHRQPAGTDRRPGIGGRPDRGGGPVRGQPGRAGVRGGHLPGHGAHERPADLRCAGWLGCARAPDRVVHRAVRARLPAAGARSAASSPGSCARSWARGSSCAAWPSSAMRSPTASCPGSPPPWRSSSPRCSGRPSPLR